MCFENSEPCRHIQLQLLSRKRWFGAEVFQQMKTRPHAKDHAESTIFSSLFVVEISRCCRSAGCWLHCKIYPLQHADLPHQRFGSTAGRQYSEVCRTPRELDSRVRNMGEESGVVEDGGWSVDGALAISRYLQGGRSFCE